MVSNSLGNTVVEVFEVAHGHPVRFSHLGSLDEDLKVDIVGAEVTVLEIGEELGLLLGESSFKWSKGFGSNNPGTDSGGEVLGIERTERNILPDLEVASAPVVEEGVPENVIFCFADFDWLSQGVSLANDCSHFELEIKAIALRPGGVDFVG